MIPFVLQNNLLTRANAIKCDVKQSKLLDYAIIRIVYAALKVIAIQD